jgi:hypothetical protein
MMPGTYSEISGILDGIDYPWNFVQVHALEMSSTSD